MLSKNQMKFICSLHLKKHRQVEGLFLAEGYKVVEELFRAGLELKLFCTVNPLQKLGGETLLISDAELRKLSQLTTPNECVGVFRVPNASAVAQTGTLVALDGIRDPGNLGTIIRLCDWFGITDLVCSTDCVEVFNPKVVQATMGSLARVRVHYLDLAAFLSSDKREVYGAFMDGESVYGCHIKADGIWLMGNEAKGIRPEIHALIDRKISIPRFGALQKAESLNVATATGILLSEIRRRGLD